MSIVKSFSVDNWDMFCIRHNSDNFTMIDCNINKDSKESLIKAIKEKAEWKSIHRFISTHPDEDHIHGLEILDDDIGILNFYTVKNDTTKTEKTTSFERYKELRDDPKKAFYLYKGCSRKWMNQACDERGSAWISILRPDLENEHYKEVLEKVKDWESPNNLSPIIKYSIEDGVRFLWMGDLEWNFQEKIKDEIWLDKIHILFAPHHGRESWKVPEDILKDKLNPDIVIIGEASSENLNYYSWYNTITQISAWDITFDCWWDRVDIYVSNETYSVDFLEQDSNLSSKDWYIWTLYL